FGREVYAVPGNINSENSAGTNKLIKSGQGYCVTCYQDVLEEMKIQITTKKDFQKDIKLSSNEKLVVDCLKKGEKHFEEIIALTHLDIKTANTCLTTLSIRGIIKRLAGNYYSL
ncbi:MAG: DNA-protecting protein DprA, partial [Clostridia bacterium]|nr:DNA-protecting protein DprA [Clostridia bacterium]